MLRATAVLAVALGLVLFMAYLRIVGKGPFATEAERHMRRMKDRSTAPPSIAPITFAELVSMPRGRPLAEYAPLEQRGRALEGYVQRMLRAPDGDFHLDFAPTTNGPDGPLVPYVSVEVTPQWHVGSRTWRYENFLRLFRPNFGGVTPWDSGPRRVRVSGWLMYDFEYEGAPSVFGFPDHLSHWEIHPITKIEVWDDSTAAFQEIPR